MAKRSKQFFTKRFWSQLIFFFVVNPFGLLSARWLCLPVFNCHSCPWAVTACPVGVIAKFVAMGMLPLLAIGVIGVFAALAGRIYCGWACPFGFLQDLLARVPLPKFSMPGLFRFTKYAVLIVGVLVLPYLLTDDSPWFFCRLCPVGTIEGAVPAKVQGWTAETAAAEDESSLEGSDEAHEGYYAGALESPAGLPWLRYAILAALLLWMLFTVRPFCRYLCPLGAILSLFNKFSIWRMGVDQQNCRECGRCGRECLMDVEIYRDPGSAECVRCLECNSCEAISRRGTLFGRVRSRRSGPDSARDD